jgi:hypothetical protein
MHDDPARSGAEGGSEPLGLLKARLHGRSDKRHNLPLPRVGDKFVGKSRSLVVDLEVILVIRLWWQRLPACARRRVCIDGAECALTASSVRSGREIRRNPALDAQ